MKNIIEFIEGVADTHDLITLSIQLEYMLKFFVNF